ncbi:MAG: hypothetical protein ACLQMO_12435 [Acidobacteriaceae bacterium]
MSSGSAQAAGECTGKARTAAGCGAGSNNWLLPRSRHNSGLIIQVPLFVAPGELVSVDLGTGHYVERVRTQHKKGV